MTDSSPKLWEPPAPLPGTASVTCIHCHDRFTAKVEISPTRTTFDVTCPHCGTGWPIEVSSIRYPANELKVPTAAWEVPASFCNQCGQPWGLPACGPTHAADPRQSATLKPSGAPSSEAGSLSPASGLTSRTHAEEEPEEEPRNRPGDPGYDYSRILTDAVLAEICSKIENTIPIDWAAHLAGVLPKTLEKARQRSEAVHQRIEAARAKGGARLIALAHQDGNNGRSIARSQWLGACLYPKQLNPAVVIAGPGGGALQVQDVTKPPKRVKQRWELQFFAENHRWATQEEVEQHERKLAEEKGKFR